MGVKLQSALGGSVELNAPSTASNFTMTVPAGNGTVATTDQLANFRNRIINGDMRIDQRNDGASVTVNSFDTFSVDRFRHQCFSGAVWSAFRSSLAPTGFANSLGINITTADATPAAADEYRIQYAVEGHDVADFSLGTASAQTFTLSFWVRSSITGKYSVSFLNAAVNRSYVTNYTISAANTWEYKTVTISGDTTGTWRTDNGVGIYLCFDLGSGVNKNGTANSWNSGFATRTSDSVNVVSTLNANWQLTGVQLELGSVATPFERRSIGLETDLCRRYYQKNCIGGVMVRGDNKGILRFSWDPKMRTTPAASMIGSNDWFNIVTYSSASAGFAIAPEASGRITLSFDNAGTGFVASPTSPVIALTAEL